MNKTDLHTFHNNIVAKLWSNVLFFLSKENIPEDFLEKIHFLIDLEIWNKIFIVDYTMGPVVYRKGIDKNGIILKGTELEQITFLLIEKKTKLQPHEFNYIFEKYFEQLDCVLYVTNWLQNNLNYIEEKDEYILGSFKLQFFNFKKHFKDIVKHFFPNKLELPQTRFDAIKIIEENLEEISHSKKYNKIPKKDFIFNETLAEESSDKKKNLNTVKRKPLITEAESDEAVLRSIFNIGK
jgi:hypothetical protein